MSISHIFLVKQIILILETREVEFGQIKYIVIKNVHGVNKNPFSAFSSKI